ncbi:MAG TPA: twin-arginine translocase TatA/TatE family subunit [Candidatus Limnocylindrales bacterium]|nr:twin-arginine translocase TatA/TatE family subunit [Candidatus Limnocylindrales bacterium]HEX5452104.1 twin-arginine translocase TatA/TatE family subunit [Candidatus Limnocylindrales bacterium]
MTDVFVVLVIILIIALIVRGPKTLPQIGALFGRGYKATREEAERLRSKDGPTNPEPPAS